MSSSLLSVLFLLCLNNSGLWNVNAAGPLKIAWMATGRFIFFFNASTSLGSLAYSVDEIEADPFVLPGYTFDIRYKDSACDSKQAVGHFFDFLEDSSWDPDLILGPICSGAMQPVAQLASYLNKPTFGWISSDPPLADKSIYTTLVRFLWSFSNLGEGLALLLDRFDWRRVFIISTVGGDYGALGEGLRDVLLQNGDFTVSRWVQNVPENPSRDDIKAIYELLKKDARIVILCTPEDELRDWALALYESDLHKGDYVILYANQQTATPDLYAKFTGSSWFTKDDADDSKVISALSNFFLFFARTQNFEALNTFLDNFNTSAHSNGWPTRIPSVPPATPDFYSLFLYDALRVYSTIATSEGTVNDGTVIFNAAKGSLTTGGATGDIILDGSCDRIADYYIFKQQSNDLFDVVASTQTKLDETILVRDLVISGEIIWGDGSVGAENAPLDSPKCGFFNELCPPLLLYIVPAAVVFVLIIIAVAAFFIYRKISYEGHLANMAWKLNYDEINIYTGQPGAASFRAQSMQLRKSRVSLAESALGQMYVTAGNYRGAVVAMKPVRKAKVDLNRAVLEEMRAMQEANHNNLNTFMGACTDPPHIVCVWDYCTKGSLQDVIWNENIQLDDMFKFSICIDILKGVAYLHESTLRVHGRLKSSNVLIDGRWVCKLTDFGLSRFSEGQDEDPDLSDHVKLSKLMWMAPEVLREAGGSYGGEGIPPSTLSSTTPSADIYAAGIIIKEVICRNGPYTEYDEELTQEDILRKIKDVPSDAATAFRPPLTDLDKGLQTDAQVIQKLEMFIHELYAEDPKARPSASHAVKTMTKINPLKKTNVMDNMIMMMEKHSKHLEEIVSERTVELEEEKKKTETLLYRMLPRSVTDDLKAGKPVEAESYECVTIYFSDIMGFTELAAECTPLQVVDILNAVYTLFDEIIPKHDVYKVETVGDVYVLVSGLPIRNGDRHAVEVCNCALDILSGVMGLKVPHKPSHHLHIRIGIHTGPIVTGVVGLTSPRYCLFGDTMNTTSRMESHGAAMRIHLSSKAHEALSKFGGYNLAGRGEIAVKGKGNMHTYWLLGRDDFKQPLPDFETEFKKDNPPPQKLPTTVGKSTNPRVIRPSRESGFSEPINFTETPDTSLLHPGGFPVISSPPEGAGNNILTPVDTTSNHTIN